MCPICYHLLVHEKEAILGRGRHGKYMKLGHLERGTEQLIRKDIKVSHA